MAAQIQELLKKFDIVGNFMDVAPHGNGHINDTFAAAFEQGGKTARYIVQRINGNIFSNPEKLMENIANVTGHLRKKAEAQRLSDIGRRVLTLIQAKDGHSFVYDCQGQAWRCYIFIEGAKSIDIAKTPAQAFEAAKAFGKFQRDLADYEGPRLFETIPKFHHTPSRFAELLHSVEEDANNRAALAKAEIETALSRESLAGTLISLQESGSVPERITHNDTKLNNVLLDGGSGQAICVVDLDTVMPGLSLYDFGDLVRSAASAAAEDEPDLRKVAVQAPIFEALARGYLQGIGEALLPIEKDHLVASAKLLAFECGIRFLTDYLNGDIYFKTNRESHNLDRCRTQFTLLKSLEKSEEELQAITKGLGG